jgi:sarcosine oxidase delta subunit
MTGFYSQEKLHLLRHATGIFKYYALLFILENIKGVVTQKWEHRPEENI